MPSLLRNISWLGIANGLVKPLWFVFITAACMRLLGVHEYGVMAAAMSLGMIAAAFVDLGMTQYTIREVSREPSHAARFVSNFLALRLVNSSAAWAATIGAGFVLGYEGRSLAAVVFAGAYALALNLTNYCRSIYRAFEDLRQEAVMLILEKVLVIAMGLALLVTTRLAAWTLAGMALGMILTTAANAWWIDRHFAAISPRLLSWVFLKKSLKIMIPFGLAGLFTVVYYRVDMVMIEAFLGAAPTGQYGAAFRILEGLNVLPAIVSIAAVYPRLAKLYHGASYARFDSVLKKSLLGTVGVSLLITVGLFLLAAPVIRLLDPDPAYGPAAGALQILVWSFPLLCANTLLYAALISMEAQRFVSAALGMAVLVNVGLNFYLIPAYGINGAAVATIIPELVLLAVYATRYKVARRRIDKYTLTHEAST